MKRMIVMVVLILLSFTLVSCDYPEKSFKALRRELIPTEVSRDFTLERGIYAPFIWTSNNDALVIDGTNVTVIQQEEDVLVTITATINQTSESFEILVLKIGTEKTWREKGEDAIAEMRLLYNEIDNNHLKLPKRFDDFYIEYNFDDISGLYGYYENEDCYYISSGYQADNNEIFLLVSFYIKIDANTPKHCVYRENLYFYVHRLSMNDPYMKTLNDVNINNYTKTFKFNLFLEVGDYIEFADHNKHDVKLSFRNYSSLKRISDTKYQLVKPIENVSYLKGYLIITIDNMPKKILITVNNKGKR